MTKFSPKYTPNDVVRTQNDECKTQTRFTSLAVGVSTRVVFCTTMKLSNGGGSTASSARTCASTTSLGSAYAHITRDNGLPGWPGELASSAETGKSACCSRSGAFAKRSAATVVSDVRDTIRPISSPTTFDRPYASVGRVGWSSSMGRYLLREICT